MYNSVHELLQDLDLAKVKVEGARRQLVRHMLCNKDIECDTQIILYTTLYCRSVLKWNCLDLWILYILRNNVGLAPSFFYIPLSKSKDFSILIILVRVTYFHTQSDWFQFYFPINHAAYYSTQFTMQSKKVV